MTEEELKDEQLDNEASNESQEELNEPEVSSENEKEELSESEPLRIRHQSLQRRKSNHAYFTENKKNNKANNENLSNNDKSKKLKYNSPTQSHLPEHGPIDPNTGKEVLLSLKDVSITFRNGSKVVEAVKKASFDIYKGETFSLVGESGSGKTTIGRAVIGVNNLAGGEILYKGVRISGKIPHSLNREVIRNIQMIFQDPAASLNERATIEYIISEGLYNFGLYENEKDRMEKVENVIKEVGLLPEHLTRYPHEFSGGQRQRIGVARAIVMKPELIVADEPISALDVSIRAQILNLLKKFQKEDNLTILFIAHDLSIVRYISDRIGVIYKGNIVEIADGEELFNFPLHPYTQSLISAIPLPDPEIEKRKILQTYDPSIHDYSTDKPEMVDIGHNHFIFGNKAEIEKYKAIRDKGVPLKTIKISDSEEQVQASSNLASSKYDIISDRPIHDTGSLWYKVFGFILPIICLIIAVIQKKHNYIRNYQAFKKGAIFGLIFRGAVVALFLLALLFATFK